MLNNSALTKIKKEENSDGMVWIKNKTIYVINEKGSGIPPAINPCPGVKLIVNGTECNHLVVPNENDTILIQADTIKIEELIELTISENEMEAYLHTRPAKAIKYEILDCESSNRIDIAAFEVIENVDYILEDKIYKTLESRGIKIGIIEENLETACNTYEEKNILIAQGIAAIPAKNAWIELMFSQEKSEINLDEDEFGRVDFRNFIDYKSSCVGDVLAIKHPMESGVNGITVTGKEVIPVPPKDTNLSNGNGVLIEDNGMLARCIKSGRAIKQAVGGTVSISVNEKLEINSDVDIKTGNIKFKGNVIVNRNIKEAMEVAAKEDVFIKGDCHFAMVQSGNNLAIKGNVISSRIEAGNRNIIIRNPGEDIKPIVESIEMIISEIDSSCNGSPVSVVYPQGISSKIKELLNSKYQKLPQDIYSFIIALKSSQYDCLIQNAGQVIASLKFLLGNCSSIKTLEHLYKIKGFLTGLNYYAQDDRIIEGNIILNYAANSDIKAKGYIRIGNKGCFNCNIYSDENISISGIVRGSKIHSEKIIEINEIGSEMGVPTVVSVPTKGIIKIKKIFNDNIIKVGPFTYRFIEPVSNVYARIVEGKLVIK